MLCHQNIVRYEQILFLIQTAVSCGIKKFRFTGGEPLVRAGFVDFVAEVANIRGVEDISLTTNGVALAPVAQRLKNNGLRRINISLDSLNAENFQKITRTSFLEQVLEGIQAALDAKLDPVKINTVIMPENFTEVVDFARLSIGRPLHVRFIEFMPIGNASLWTDNGFIPGECVRTAIEKELGKLIDVHSPGGAGPAKYSRLDGALGTVGFISPMTGHFCATCNRLRMTSDGRLRACLTLDDEINIKGILEQENTDQLLCALQDIIGRKPGLHSLEKCTVNDFNRHMSGIGG
jgi:cyclic pyranopterin phosphate synthase